MSAPVFDHLAIACTDLEEGAAWLTERLGVPPGGGGRHPDFGTHNRLWSLGPSEYLEIIAIDPDAPPPEEPRWFGLDRFSGPPRLVAWIARVQDPALWAALGQVKALSRDRYRWRMVLPGDGAPPWRGAHPLIIAWDGPHPAEELPDSGLRLTGLRIAHPECDALANRLGSDDPRIELHKGPACLMARIATPAGPATL